VEHLKKCDEEEDEEKLLNESGDDYGIGKLKQTMLNGILCKITFLLYLKGYDCPLIEKLFQHCSTIAGSSLTAAELINSNRFNYAINWYGGWHHCKR